MEAVGCRIAGGQEAKTEILVDTTRDSMQRLRKVLEKMPKGRKQKRKRAEEAQQD